MDDRGEPCRQLLTPHGLTLPDAKSSFLACVICLSLLCPVRTRPVASRQCSYKIVRPDRAEEFKATWAAREAHMRSLKGLVSFELCEVGAGIVGDYEVEHVWETREDWEAWLNDRPRYISNLPQGVFQLMPENKEGVPETFVPILDPTLSPNK